MKEKTSRKVWWLLICVKVFDFIIIKIVLELMLPSLFVSNELEKIAAYANSCCSAKMQMSHQGVYYGQNVGVVYWLTKL